MRLYSLTFGLYEQEKPAKPEQEKTTDADELLEQQQELLAIQKLLGVQRNTYSWEFSTDRETPHSISYRLEEDKWLATEKIPLDQSDYKQYDLIISEVGPKSSGDHTNIINNQIVTARIDDSNQSIQLLITDNGNTDHKRIDLKQMSDNVYQETVNTTRYHTNSHIHETILWFITKVWNWYNKSKK